VDRLDFDRALAFYERLMNCICRAQLTTNGGDHEINRSSHCSFTRSRRQRIRVM
jgi:hypothetical protein